MENDVTGGMKLKIDSAVKIIMNSIGAIPVIFCGLAEPAFLNVCLNGHHNITNECTVIKHVDFKSDET